MCTGWTWDYVDEHMTFPRLRALEKYMTKHPPVQFLVASYLGYKAPVAAVLDEAEPREWTEETLQNFMSDFAMAGGKIG